MDGITEQLVAYASEFTKHPITESARDAAIRHLVDSVACAIAGSESEAGRLAATVARRVPLDGGATIIGDGTRVMAEMAAFANTSMVRAWDWNDGLYARFGGHASDMISAMLAVGEITSASPEQVLSAMALAYECLGALGDFSPLGRVHDVHALRNGWEQGVFMCPAAALGVGSLLGLNKDQLAVAVSLSILPGPQLGQTRSLETQSMWKASATGETMRRAIFAATLAEAGFTCPLAPFEGGGGLWDKVTGPFEINLPAQPGGPMVIELSYMKRYPAELHILAVVDLVPNILAWTSVEEIESIVIETYYQAYRVLSLYPSNYDPKIREDADHSLPYVLAASLVDGRLSRASYQSDRILDPYLRPIMAKIIVRENKQYTRDYRPPGKGLTGEPHFRLTIRKHSGDEHVEEIKYGKGHSSNPMMRSDIDEKLDEACEGIISDDHREEIREAWWNLGKARTISEPIQTIAHFH